MFTNLLPITGLIRRELISSLRQKRFFYIVLIAVAAAGLSIIAMWPPERPMPWQMRSASESIFIALGLTLAIGAALSVPALSGSSIVSERVEQTFELLAMTTAKPWHVLLAKLINSAGHYLLLVIALMPFAACAFFLVGMNLDVLWRTLMIVSSTALLCAAIGVMCSAKLRNPMAAVGLSYLGMITVLGWPLLLLLIVLELFGFHVVDDFLNRIGIYVMPMVAFVTALGGGPSATSTTRNVEVCSALTVAAAILVLLVAHMLVRRNWGMSATTEHGTQEQERPKPLVQTADRKPRSYRPARNFRALLNPVLLREHWYDYPMSGWMLFLQVGVPFALAFSACGLIALLHLLGMTGQNSEAMLALIGWQILQAMLLPVLMAALTANIFTKEHERENIDALRMTLLRPLEIFWGKMLASLRVGMTLLLAACLGSLPLLVIVLVPVKFNPWNSITPGTMIFYAFLMLVESIALVWAVTAYCSIEARRMASAVVTSFIIGAMLLGGNAMAIVMVGESMGFYDVDTWVGMFSPYFAYALYLSSPNSSDAIDGWRASHFLAMATVFLFSALGGWRFTKSHMCNR
jgi:hypothetical protein